MEDLKSLSTEELKRKLKEAKASVAENDTRQLSLKVALNSCYGAIGNQYFRWFDIRQAEAITIQGQTVIQWIERALNAHLNKLFNTEDVPYVIYCDTDSVYICLEEIVKRKKPDAPVSEVIDFLNTVCSKGIEPFIEKQYDELKDYLNHYQQQMFMKREVISDIAIWLAKKKYIVNVWDSEGVRYDTPKMKIMGVEVVRSSTPQWCRTKLKDAIKIILQGDQNKLHEFIRDNKSEWMKLSPEDIAFPRGVSDIDKYTDKTSMYKKGTPIHVKGSIIYNHGIADRKLDRKYEKIRNGDKIKFLYLRMPNAMRSPVIAFPNALPEEFGVHPHVDYDTQWEKAFLSPLENILEIIGWTHREVVDLTSFFGED